MTADGAPADWAASTLVFVRDVDAAIRFYVDMLGFTLNMRHEHEGQALVAGVSHGDGFGLLLASQWPDRVGTAIFYAAFGPEDFARIRADLEAKRVTTKDGWWGQPLMIVADPDGNQIYFPVP